jgi:putative flippase GtrA
MPGPTDRPGPQFLRFCVVGAGNTAVTLGADAVLLAAGVHYLVASAVAFSLGALNGYVLNRTWTFAAGGFRLDGLARYVVVQLLCLALDLELVRLLVGDGGLPKLAAQACALPLVAVAGFAANRHWTFRRGGVTPSAGLP